MKRKTLVRLSLLTLKRGLCLVADLLEHGVATVCCSILILWLILLLAAETGHLCSVNEYKVYPKSRSCFVSVLILYFFFNGIELLHWLFLGEQYITGAVFAHLN